MPSGVWACVRSQKQDTRACSVRVGGAAYRWTAQRTDGQVPTARRVFRYRRWYKINTPTGPNQCSKLGDPATRMISNSKRFRPWTALDEIFCQRHPVWDRQDSWLWSSRASKLGPAGVICCAVYGVPAICLTNTDMLCKTKPPELGFFAMEKPSFPQGLRLRACTYIVDLAGLPQDENGR